MKKYIVLSVNDNQDYLYFTPLVCWAWRYFGWEPIVMYRGGHSDVANYVLGISQDHDSSNEDIYFIQSIEGYRDDTITQISRLYASACGPENLVDISDFLMTGDIDMLPLSNYWRPDINGVTVYGHDLTGFGHYPICYIGMKRSDWAVVMGIPTVGNPMFYIKRDLDSLPQAKDPDFYKYWFTDQDLITQRLNEYGKEKITFINRGQGSQGYARGRVDRGSGGWVLNQPELIDAHLRQQTHHKEEKVLELMALLKHVWPNENFDWFMTYSIEYRKLTGHKA